MTAKATTERPRRVCHLAATTVGATWMFEQLRDLRDRHGYDVSAVVNGTEGQVVDLLRSANIHFHVCDLGVEGKRRALSLLRATFELVRLFRTERFDVVQTHIFSSILAARPAAWIAGVPVRLSMIAGPFHLEASSSRLVERLTRWMETALIPSCEKSLRLCRELGVPQERLRLIYYSVDTTRFDHENVGSSGLRDQFGWSTDTPVIVLVAYFYPRFGHNGWIPRSLQGLASKGHEDLISAALHVLEEFPNARFALVGGAFGGATDCLDEAKALVERLDLADRVVFLGHREDVSGILKDATVAVQASLCENLGGTLEALSMGRPMVVTRVGGMVDVVKDGITGLLAEPRNPTDLAEKLCALLREPEHARQIGERGRALVLERFSLRRTVDDLSALYIEQAAAARARGGRHGLALSLAKALVVLPWLAFVWVRARASAAVTRGITLTTGDRASGPTLEDSTNTPHSR